MASRDAARFVGRTEELARLESLLEESAPVSVVLLHGSAGVGKSALLRELARQAEAPGDRGGHRRGPRPGAAGRGAGRGDRARPAGRPTAAAARLLGAALGARCPSAPEPAAPPALRRPGRDRVAAPARPRLVHRRLGEPRRRARPRPARPGRRRGPARRPRPRRPCSCDRRPWPGRAAHRSPWSSPSTPAAFRPRPRARRRRRSSTPCCGRLLDAQPEGDARRALAVAALARVTSPSLLAEVLPDCDAERAFSWLSAQPSAEPLGDGVTLHDLVGRAVRADLRRRSPEIERDLRRRLVDALYARSAREGLLRLTLDLQHLVQDPAIRWGFSWDMSGRFHIDAPQAWRLRGDRRPRRRRRPGLARGRPPLLRGGARPGDDRPRSGWGDRRLRRRRHPRQRPARSRPRTRFSAPGCAMPPSGCRAARPSSSARRSTSPATGPRRWSG